MIPESVKVGYKTYRIEQTEHISPTKLGLYGYCDNDNAVIYINPSATRQDIAQTLLHEILHAIWWMQGFNHQPTDEERVVNGMGLGLHQVWQENPEVRKYLNAGLSK